MTSPYTVRLAGADQVPPVTRIAAEIRFLTEIERLLGGPHGVLAAWSEDARAFEEWDATAGPDTPALRTLWDEAMEAATAAAVGEVAVPGAWFDFQIMNEPAPAWERTSAPF